MKRILIVLADSYLKIPIIIDMIIVSVIVFYPKKYYFLSYKITDRATLLNLLSNLVGTCVSLAGFILAALTIVVTFKANIKSKNIQDSENAMEYFFSTPHYNSIVETFKKAIAEFTLCFIVLYGIWIVEKNITDTTIDTAIIASWFIVSIAIFRSLLVLFKILTLEKFEASN